MGLQCGIVGLPNVGKSTLFNALSNAGAEAGNFPFCTIEPNIGVVAVPDRRLDKLTEVVKPEKTTPTFIEIVDIAGLVKGASEGKGRGNAFLSHIREVDLILHVVRCFDDENVVHVDGTVDPIRDIKVIEDELLLKDLETVEKKIGRLESQAKSGDKAMKKELEIVSALRDFIENGNPARHYEINKEYRPILRDMFLLSSKKVLYVCNVGESDIIDRNKNEGVEKVKQYASYDDAYVLTLCAKVEAEIAELESEEKDIYLKELGIEISGLDNLVNTSYEELGLITFFTAGPKEVRAWTIIEGTKTPQAAGTIHTDFERGFIRGETIKYDDYVSMGSESAVKDAGRMRSEGKDYVVEDGDIIYFRFNV